MMADSRSSGGQCQANSIVSNKNSNQFVRLIDVGYPDCVQCISLICNFEIFILTDFIVPKNNRKKIIVAGGEREGVNAEGIEGE